MLSAVVVALAVVPATAGAACKNANLVPTNANRLVVESSLRCLVNAERTARGLKPLKAERHLRAAALTHARDMVVKGYFGHVDKAGRGATARVRLTGYFAGYSRFFNLENIGFGFGAGFGNPAGILNQWMHNLAHRLVVIDPRVREFGVGVAIGLPQPGGASRPGATWAMEEGVRTK
jgi:uncharacterized protein YkwD